ncbi:MAG: hypothetical protein WC641_06160 [Patescibacteria group bacterium]
MGFKTSTEKQIKFAKHLGIVGAAEMERGQLSELITRESIKTASACLRRWNIRMGTVLRWETPLGHSKSFVVLDIISCELRLMAVDGSHQAVTHSIIYAQDDPHEFEILYSPPENFLHWLCFRTQARKRLLNLGSRRAGGLNKHFFQDFGSRLASEHKLATDYDEYWNKAVGNALLDKFCQELSD